jgi:hypothetical protein
MFHWREPAALATSAGSGTNASASSHEIVEAGTVAGLVGGVAMALFASVCAAAAGIGFWTPMKAVAAIAVGTGAYEMGIRAVLLGIAIHVLTSTVLGVLFASVTPRDVLPATALVLGASAAVVILVLMNLVVLPTYDWTAPSVGPTSRSHLMWGNVPGRVPGPSTLLTHLIYGAGLALAPALRRRFGASSRSLRDRDDADERDHAHDKR